MFIPDVSPVTLQLDLNGMYHLESVLLSFKVSDSSHCLYFMWKCCFLTAGFLVRRARGLTRWSSRGRGISGALGSPSCTWPPTVRPPFLRWARRSLAASRTLTATHCPPPPTIPTGTRRYENHQKHDIKSQNYYILTHIYEMSKLWHS